jgi:hypothetical protein
MKLNPNRETTMCLIQCIDCPSCIGLSLVPLKDDYFNGRKPKCFWFWPCKDLVRRFKKTVATFILWFMTIFARIQDAREKILITNLHIRANAIALAEVFIANSKHADWLLAVLKTIVKIITPGLTY